MQAFFSNLMLFLITIFQFPVSELNRLLNFGQQKVCRDAKSFLTAVSSLIARHAFHRALNVVLANRYPERKNKSIIRKNI